MKSITHSIIIFILSLSIFSCSDNEIKPNPTEGLTLIGEAYALGAGARVELWANEELFAGYNKLFVALYDSVSGERITEAHVHLNPVMTIDSFGRQHSCPVINPEDENAVEELFPGAAVFIEPSGDMGFWTMSISVHNHHNQKFGKASLDITVADPELSQIRSFVTVLHDNMFVSYNFPDQKKVGVNDFELVVYEMESAMDFIPAGDYTISLEPEMPSMGHGSPNNVNPVYDDVTGSYHGKVNFTMTGEWRLNLILDRGDETKSVFFDVTLK